MNYPIRVVSKITGLSIDTLRAWERRYGVVAPDRCDRGRSYTESDVRRLLLLRDVVDKGHAIGQVAEMGDEQLRELLDELDTTGAAEPVAQTRPHLPSLFDLSAVMAAVKRFDYGCIDREMGRLAALMPCRDFLHQVVHPFMARVGEEWHQGLLSIAQEHMVSALLTNVLGTLVRINTRENPPCTLLFAAPSDEKHEFGLLSSAMLAAGGGLGVVYLGGNLPADEIVTAAREANVQVVVLAVVGTSGIDRADANIKHIAQNLPASIELWIGGSKADELIHSVTSTRAVWISDFHMLECRLRRLGAGF